MSNQKFQNALQRVEQPTPPIWLMRQAGRYHSHYQGLRRQHSFVELCKLPEVAAEAARGPVADFGFDAAILFSDLLFPLEAMGIYGWRTAARMASDGGQCRPAADGR